jgi:hypothetical protein
MLFEKVLRVLKMVHFTMIKNFLCLSVHSSGATTFRNLPLDSVFAAASVSSLESQRDFFKPGIANLDLLDFAKSYSFARKTKNMWSDMIEIKYFNNSDVKSLWDAAQFRNELQEAIHDCQIDSTQAYEKWKQSVEEWLSRNKFNRGIHWKSPMECSIRAVNLAAAASIFKTEISCDGKYRKKLSRLLILHGEVISMNPEIKRSGLTTNHTITNFAALLILSLVIPEYRKANEWHRVGLGGLDRCVEEQIYNDGFDFEGSTRYHCYVLDVIAHTIIIGQRADISFSNMLLRKTYLMFYFLFAIMDRNGYVHQIGDNDSRMFLSPGYIEDFRFFKELFNLIDFGSNITSHIKNDSIIVFESGGIAVAQTDCFHSILAVVPIGQKGLGGHNHEDLLQLCLSYNGHPLFVDPGTGNYNYSYELRNLLRKRESHGVPYMMERANYLELPTMGPFDIASCVPFKTFIESSSNCSDCLLQASVLFESHSISRTLQLLDNAITVKDAFRSGDSENVAVSKLILAPSWSVEYYDDRRIIVSSVINDECCYLEIVCNERIRIDKVLYSSKYNRYEYTNMITTTKSFSSNTYISYKIDVL